MEKRTWFCDKCGKEVSDSKDLKTITIGNGGNLYAGFSDYNRFEVYKKIDLCLECRQKLGIELKKEKKEKQIKTIQERLFDVVAEIVAEVSNHQNS